MIWLFLLQLTQGLILVFYNLTLHAANKALGGLEAGEVVGGNHDSGVLRDVSGGLLGTVLGMYQAFGAMGNDLAANARPMVLAQGVGKAIITTMFGLIVSIPCLVFHAMMRRRAARRISGLETLGVALEKAFA